ncbi:hypothetical protein HN799_01080 [Candidatus Woesearchaeota archaeon]|jgi:hypothetical protein|nr:hypothetical protein [Candidatus Woesearchaeota archaeon]MBT4151412.1 hypothetical protein [Candidatus Woesearchaeota archaeon]MBT7331845.1 hypothetical protein [Candidatus Woesearchaeota archaeon]
MSFNFWMKKRKLSKLLDQERFYFHDLEEQNKELLAASKIILGRKFSEKRAIDLQTLLKARIRKQVRELKRAKRVVEEIPSIAKVLTGSEYFHSELLDSVLEKNAVLRRDINHKKVENDLPAIKEAYLLILNNLLAICENLQPFIRKRKLTEEDVLNIITLLDREKELLTELENTLSGLVLQVKDRLSTSQMTRRKFLKVMAAGAFYAKASIPALGGVWFSLFMTLKILSLRLPWKKKDGLAILITDNLPLISLPYFAEGIRYRCELAVGYKANVFIKNATIMDFINLCFNDEIQSIAIFAHGSFNTIKFSDKTISAYELAILYNKECEKRNQEYNKLTGAYGIKKGFLYKYTCGTEPKGDVIESWGSGIFKANRIIQWKRVVNAYDIFFNPMGDKDNLINLLNENTIDPGYKLLKKIKIN